MNTGRPIQPAELGCGCFAVIMVLFMAAWSLFFFSWGCDYGCSTAQTQSEMQSVGNNEL